MGEKQYAGYAIVTDGLWRKSMSVIRSLGKSGYHVTVMGDSFLTMGLWSRYASRRFYCKTASDDPEAFGNGLLKLIESFDSIRPVIVPMEDPTIVWCSENREKLQHKAQLLLPPPNSLGISEDKSRTLKIAGSIDINCPKTYYPENLSEFNEILSQKHFDEFVLKPHSGSGSAGVVYCKTGDNFDYSSHWNKFGPLIIQERVPHDGESIGVSVIMDKNSHVVARFSHKRLEQYPNSGGPGTIRISVFAPEIEEDSIRLLKHLSWTGVAMVEWKINTRTGKPVLMEINPRFWGSLELAVRCGVNFPLLYAKLARGEKVEGDLSYNEGVVCRWLIPGDILRYITKDKNEREPLCQFFKGLPRQAEEWDKTDLRGTFAALWCQGLSVLNPKYWKYIRK